MYRDTAIAHANPPLPFTRDAIVNQLRHQATNGPAYVQHSATKALAHLKGLYAEARYEARLAYEAARDALRDAAQQAAQKISSDHQPIAHTPNRGPITEEEMRLADEYFGITSNETSNGTPDEEAGDEESHSGETEDEPP